MATLTLDLPDDALVDVGRLAQQFNVARQEIIRRAVASYARSLALAEEVAALTDAREAFARRCRDLDARLAAERRTVIGLSADRDALAAERDGAAAARRAQLAEVSGLRLEARRLATRLTTADRERDAALRRTRKVEALIQERTYAALRDAEVEKFNGLYLEALARESALEKTGEKLEREAERLFRQMKRAREAEARAARKTRAAEAALAKLGKEAQQRERLIGNLRAELAKARGELVKLVKVLGGVRAAAASPPGGR